MQKQMRRLPRGSSSAILLLALFCPLPFASLSNPFLGSLSARRRVGTASARKCVPSFRYIKSHYARFPATMAVSSSNYRTVVTMRTNYRFWNSLISDTYARVTAFGPTESMRAADQVDARLLESMLGSPHQRRTSTGVNGRMSLLRIRPTCCPSNRRGRGPVATSFENFLIAPGSTSSRWRAYLSFDGWQGDVLTWSSAAAVTPIQEFVYTRLSGSSMRVDWQVSKAGTHYVVGDTLTCTRNGGLQGHS